MKSFHDFCVDVGLDEEAVKLYAKGEGETWSEEVKKECKMLKNGFVWYVWKECTDVKAGKMMKVEKVRDVVMNFFRYEGPVKGFAMKINRLENSYKKCQKARKREGKDDAVCVLLKKDFVGVQVQPEAVSTDVEEPGPSGVRLEAERYVRKSEVEKLKRRFAEVERENEREKNTMREAMCEMHASNRELNAKYEEAVRDKEQVEKEMKKLKMRRKKRNALIKNFKRKEQRRMLKMLQMNRQIKELQAKCFNNERNLTKMDEIVKAREESVRKELGDVCETLKGKNVRLEEALQKEKKKKVKAQKKISELKKKVDTVEVLAGKVRDAKKEAKEIKRAYGEVMYEKMELEESFEERVQERVEELEKDEEICTFKGGKFVDCVREVYQDLMTMNVGANNVEKIVRIVLKKLSAKDVKRLPKRSFASTMLLEARALAQMQCASAITGSGSSATLCTDGTTKWGYHYGTYDVSLASGQMLTLGLRPMVSGSAAHTLNGFQEVVKDIAKMSEGGSETVNEIVAAVKNTMSDRHAVEKKFNVMLKEYRTTVLPKVVEGWAGMSLEEQKSVKRMNNFFCGMHFVVGLANQAGACLKVWEKDVLGEKKVGSMSLPGAVEGGCGTVRLVRTLCKSVQDRACEKSGKPVGFRVFLKSEKGICDVHLAPFRGNRFNILFHNGAGVYFLYPHLLEFFERVKDENELMRAVYEDLKVDEYRTGVRALGLMDKIVTGPLWKVLNVKEHMSDMSERYERMMNCFENWSRDASEVVQGEVKMYDDVPIEMNEVFDSLVKPCANDGACKDVLQCMFKAFHKLGERMLESQLSGGEHSEMSTEALSETVSVPRTNVGAERDFGMFDRLLREKPRATEYAIEGIIMCRRNQTSEWRDSLEAEMKKKMMKVASDSVKEQRRELAERRQRWFEEKEKMMKEKKEQKARREQREKGAKKGLLSSRGKAVSVKQMRELLKGVGQAEESAVIETETEEDGPTTSKRARVSSDVDELIGRLLVHRTETEGLTEQNVCVIVKKQQGKYIFRYDGNEVLYEYTNDRLLQDWESGHLKEIEVTVTEVIGREIEYLWLDENGENVWYRGRVVGEAEGGLCNVEYEPVGEDGEGDEDDDWNCEVLAEPLFEDYQKRHVRFV
ncbi:uncharacterized protein LOC119723859 [Patiria miniata]|uniref:Uncharacterized protein n=1 Tax=Patiria miniata TaxID=46514 RepID=A0A913ZFU9_PATMI|nr:uncharacterized protein LOC119723859 [Patiria miniata]